MTLADLAALAAKVEGFARPRACCPLCRGTSLAWGTEPCLQCGCTGWTDDNSPAALLMAVVRCVSERAMHVEVDEYQILVGAYERRGAADLASASPESIARAALVALLRAHGVEVGE